MKKYNIGLLGCGTVGAGVYKGIIQNEYLNESVCIKKILVRDISKKREGIDSNLFTTSIDDILDNDTLDIIIEVMGGHDLAFSAIKKALKNKKHVITANKAVIAPHLKELLSLAKENNVSLLYEASVCGGIPIISPLIRNSKVNEVFEIKGIMNGSTNYILTLLKNGITLDNALKDAKEKGFLEADPTDDLCGFDAARKLAILSSISYKSHFKEEDVIIAPLKGITDSIIKYLDSYNLTIKYIANSNFENENVTLKVFPYILTKDDLMSNILYETNLVSVNLSNTKTLSFIGYGAGMMPTANSILTDLSDIIDNRRNYDINFLNDIKSNKDFKSYFLILTENEEIKVLDLISYSEVLKEYKNLKFIAIIDNEAYKAFKN